ncbi:MAG: putative selenocysteine system protein [Candidatus Freyarchaeota archaeon]
MSALKSPSRLRSEPPHASTTIKLDHPSPLQSVYYVISQGSACALLTEKPLSMSSEAEILSFDHGGKTLYRVSLSDSGVKVDVWAENPSQAQRKAQEIAEKISQTGAPQPSHLTTIMEELDRAVALLLTQAPKRQIYQLIADARERVILTLQFRPVTLQMAETLNHLAQEQDSPLDAQTAKTIVQRIFSWKKQLKT